ncbi:hypothetical protein GBF38_007679 [Scomber scombrus]|uniref:Uncharacterized protein n=1 Tax=Scomber scombrus TaxID=13677 RepID=A0AAV1NB15_SCOSC
MRKAPRTQKFSRHYSLTFVRFAGDAAARRSCSHSIVCASGSPGLRSWTRNNTREPRYVRNIKTNQAPSATPHLKPPLRAAGHGESLSDAIMLIMLLFEEEGASPGGTDGYAPSQIVLGETRGGGVERVVAAVVRIEVEEEKEGEIGVYFFGNL